MEALRYSSNAKKLELAQIPIPKILEPETVLIKVAFAGVCGTDLHILKGEFPCNVIKPFTLGHELSGVVVDVGPDVTSFSKGDRVTVDPNNGCMRCDVCHLGKPHFCKTGALNNTIGIYRDGGWAEYMTAPAAQVHKLPATIELEQGALCEPLSCLVHGWDVIQPVHIGQRILVVGAGIIGNLWICALHHQGHRRVTVSEPNGVRLQVLQKLDTNYDLITPNELKKRQENDSDYLFDLIIDCSGYPPAIEHAFSLLSYGGTLCIFGVAPPQETISVSPYMIFKKELKIVGVQINPFTFPKAIGLNEAMGKRYLQYANLGIKTYALKDYETAIEDLKKGTIAKAVFKFDNH